MFSVLFSRQFPFESCTAKVITALLENYLCTMMRQFSRDFSFDKVELFVNSFDKIEKIMIVREEALILAELFKVD